MRRRDILWGDRMKSFAGDALRRVTAFAGTFPSTRHVVRKPRKIAALAGAMAAGMTALIAGGWLSGCHRGKAGTGDIVVWLSADTRGYLEPCGCRRDQAGGLPARMTLVTADRTPNRLLHDAGNITNGGRSYELLKFDYLLRGMAAMGYDAVNLGKREVNLDRDTLLGKIAASKLPFVSCNVLDKQSGRPLCAPFIVKTAGGTRFGIVGVVQAEGDDLGPGIAVRPPIEALTEQLPALKTQCDFIVVLAFAPAETLHEIAAKFPEVGAVLGGDVPQSSAKAETVNRAVLFSVTEKGKVIGRLTFHPTGSDPPLTLLTSEAIKTADTIAPAPAMTALIREYKNVLRDRNLELANEEGLDPINAQTTTADLYAGEQACASCHASAHRIVLASAHAHAYRTLAQKGSEFDPECLRCHTVGYGAKDGFISLKTTPKFADVQCESCHGRGAAHIAAVQAGKTGRAATANLRAVTPNSCVRCHDTENSASFLYTSFWPKIKHGQETTPH